jgi:hypothetical protein
MTGKKGNDRKKVWIPACAGMTGKRNGFLLELVPAELVLA